MNESLHDAPPLLDQPMCRLAEAICYLAELPSSPVRDPCRSCDPFSPFAAGGSRHLLRRFPAMQTLATCKSEGVAFSPRSWPRLQVRLGFHQPHARKAEPWEAWASELRAALKRCELDNLSPSDFVEAWSPLRRPAWRYVALLYKRNERMEHNGRILRYAVMRSGGPEMFGVENGLFRRVDGPLLYDELGVGWERDAPSLLFEKAIAFTGELKTRTGNIKDIRFRSEQIVELAKGMKARRGKIPQSARKEKSRHSGGGRRLAVIHTAQHLFLRGLPAGMSIKERNRRIIEELVKTTGHPVSVRTIYTALRGTNWSGS